MIMKKIYTILLLAGCLASLPGCEKMLEKTPDGQITLDKVLSNYARSKGLLDAAYNEMYLSRDEICFVFQPVECLTDNAFWVQIYNVNDWHNGSLSLSNPCITDLWASPIEQLWPDFWRGVRLANNAIKYLPQSTAINTQEMQTWAAEPRALRRSYYMNIPESYGPMPWITEPFDPNYEGWSGLKRPTYDEIATTISDELMDVVRSGILPNRQPGANAAHVSNGVALAIRARVLLNNASLLNNPEHDRSKWQRAADAAQDVLDMSEYDLVPMSEYKNLFIGAFTNEVPEIIWRSWRDNSDINNKNGVDVGQYPYASITHIWNCGESPTQELVDCFEMTNGAMPVTYDDETHTKVTVTPEAAALGYSEAPGGDPYSNRDARFYIDILYNGANYGKPYNCTQDYIIETFVGGRNGYNDIISQETTKSCTGYYSRKDKQVTYWGPGGAWQGNEATHWVLFRLAEFYLNRAEALCELEDYDHACQMLNKVRTRAGQPAIEDVPGFEKSYDFLMPRIRNERRVELCLEGWRFHDQRRWKILDRTNRLVTGMRITRDEDGVYHYERRKIRDYQSYTDKYLVMPIPLSDAKKLPSLEQPEAWR